MPVVVVGASGLVGRSAVQAFTATSPDVRAVVRRREAAAGLRVAGAKVAVDPLEDEHGLATVMSGAHTVCHLAGGLDGPGPDDLISPITWTLMVSLAAAHLAGVRRFLYLSCAGASVGSADAHLRAKGAAEDLIAAAAAEAPAPRPEYVVIRTTRVYGPGDRWLAAMAALARKRIPVVLGSGRQVLAPVFVQDVAAVLVAADDRERIGSGTWGLQGPDRVDADGLAELLAGRRRRWVHVPSGAARLPSLAAHFGADPGWPSPVALRLLAAGSVGEDGLPDAAAEFGVRLTSLREGLARSGVASGGAP